MSESAEPHPELCSCHESCYPSAKEETNHVFLLRVCYTEWVIMGILTIMIMAKLTDLEDKEFVWFMIYSGLLLIFSIPLLVGLPSTRILPVSVKFNTHLEAATRKRKKLSAPMILKLKLFQRR